MVVKYRLVVRHEGWADRDRQRLAPSDPAWGRRPAVKGSYAGAGGGGCAVRGLAVAVVVRPPPVPDGPSTRSSTGTSPPDDAAAAELARYEKERPTSLVKDAQNILLIGSDSRSGDGNARYGRDSGTERSDTTILLHLAAGRRSATAVSLPRDLMVEVPGCLGPDGTRGEPAFTMFN